jgi:hypothetical protein
MTEPFFDAGLPRQTPQLHALLVGVGQYPHLAGGPLFGTSPAPRTFNLTQLSSPPVSASALTDWLLSQHDNPAAPVGSIELLLSPATYTPDAAAASKLGHAAGSSIAVPLATFDEITLAAQRWFLRLQGNEDNIAVFYFCGHGLEASDRYLLAADFGSNPLDWTHGIINFTRTYNNTEACRARTQCYLLDVCRDRPVELQTEAARGSVGNPLLGVSGGPARERDAPIYHAAAPGQSAAGPANGKSYFCQALIDCLNGMGARAGVGDVASVDHVSLGSALRERVDRIAEDRSIPLRCVGGGDVMLPQPVQLHRARLPVDVQATITCRPEAADAAATIIVDDTSGIQKVRPVNLDRPWRLILRSGACRVSATFAAGHPFVNLEINAMIIPPLFPIPLEIKSQ